MGSACETRGRAVIPVNLKCQELNFSSVKEGLSKNGLMTGFWTEHWARFLV